MIRSSSLAELAFVLVVVVLAAAGPALASAGDVPCYGPTCAERGCDPVEGCLGLSAGPFHVELDGWLEHTVFFTAAASGAFVGAALAGGLGAGGAWLGGAAAAGLVPSLFVPLVVGLVIGLPAALVLCPGLAGVAGMLGLLTLDVATGRSP